MAKRRIWGAPIAAITVALLLAGCGGSSKSGETGFENVFAQIAGLDAKQREARLLELVKQEGGKLDYYSSHGSDTAAALVSAFEDKYDLDVALYRATSETIVPRLIEESKVGFHGADVVSLPGLNMADLNQEGLLVEYASPLRSALVPGAVGKGWIADSFSTLVVSWNTKLVSAAERPRSWEALADPRWKGRVAIEAGDVDWYKTLHDYWVKDQGMSEQKADRLFETIARNALVVHGHTLLGQLMAAGEFAVAPNYTGRVDKFRADGAPIAWRPPVEPMITGPNGLGLVRGAKHPATAVLFADWLLSHEGQKVLVDEGQESARKDLAVEPAAARKVIDVESLLPQQKEWTDRYDRLIRLGKEVESPG